MNCERIIILWIPNDVNAICICNIQNMHLVQYSLRIKYKRQSTIIYIFSNCQNYNYKNDFQLSGSLGNSPKGSASTTFSPLAKRYRGRYRVRARQPIARMRERQLTSPRGASFGIQRFQQGSLTVGDTFLPLPSRAHQANQSTQTED